MVAVIVGAARTAIGSFRGSLASIPASQLGAVAIRGVLDKSNVAPSQVDEVIFGHVLQAGAGQNSARQAAMGAGIPSSVPSMTINKVCGSGLKAVHLAAQAIACGDASCIVAGGHENMSLAPHILPGSRQGKGMGDWGLQDSMIKDGLWCAFNDYHMGVTAENLAEQWSIDRAAQDEFAASSQQKVEAAMKSGAFRDEIVPVEVPRRKKDPLIVDTVEFPKAGVTAEGLARIPPAFKRKDGTVTAGNASGINDGAAAVVVMSQAGAEEGGHEVLARIVSYASGGVDPAIMGTGPIPATMAALAKANWTVDDLDLIEANEAFAVQALTVSSELGFDPEKVNVNGGAISLGHPIGASGCRVLVTLLHEMKRRDAKKGLATLCIGGGQGVALCVERD